MYALECGCYDDIISWSPSGLAFVIMDPKRFEKEVLPDLFKEAKFSSFDRKVRAQISIQYVHGCLPMEQPERNTTNSAFASSKM